MYCTNKSKQGWGNKSVDYLNDRISQEPHTHNEEAKASTF